MADPQAARRAGDPPRQGLAPAAAIAASRPRILSARSARTFYNVADALVPPGADGSPGAGDVDLAPLLERRLRGQGPAAARRLFALLLAIEWHPLVALRSRRPFSQLPRTRRQELLALWEASRLPARRRALAALRGVVEEGLAAHSSEGA